ncbi:MAG: binding-protein-dependent transport system inner rane component [Thermomicrobiales bacterium]|nr:binding-protein-dependent transport system inner rane component [Thermomicrobiales bacterium]
MTVVLDQGDAADSVVSVLKADQDPVSHHRTQRRWLNPLIVTGCSLLLVIVFFCVVYPLVSPHDPATPNFTQPPLAPPSATNPLGTDNFGRDILTRLAYGGRVDLIVALIATAGTVIVGGILGLLAGYTGGWLDSLIMRLVDFTLTMPYLVLVIAIVAILGPGTQNIVYAIWLVGWVAYARIVRGETLVARRQEYVDAARVLGMGHGRIMLRHILPNVAAAALIYAMADMVLNILLASSLSFLGLGTQPPNPEWGLMVAEARDFFLRDWKLMTYPGLAVLITGAALGLIGDGLAQALRPRG